MDLVNINGMMVECMQDTGVQIRWTVLEFQYTKMEINMKASLTMTKKKVMGSIIGKMVESIKDGGIWESSMGQEFIETLMKS